jgi:RimJ/RimL family protein N-acetyltransferase
VKTNVRILTSSDAQAYQALRLESLRDSPTSFGMSEDDERAFSIEQVEQRLGADPPVIPTFGAFVEGELVGMCSIQRSLRAKTRHKAMIWGMYVAPKARGRGISKALMNALLDFARTIPDLEELQLAVTVGNEAARRAYLSMGFEPYCVEPRYLKLDGVYYDIEWMRLVL